MVKKIRSAKLYTKQSFSSSSMEREDPYFIEEKLYPNHVFLHEEKNIR